MTGYINVMVVLQSCTDPLHIPLSTSSDTYVTSSDCAYNGGNMKVEVDLDMQQGEEEVNVKTEKGRGSEEEEEKEVDIKQEEDVDIKEEVSLEDTL